MIYVFIGITVSRLFLSCYIITASIDSGVGSFALHSKLTGGEKKVNHLISRCLNLVWEVTNVFLVFFFVGFVGSFPESIKYLDTVLLIPGLIVLIMISLRNSLYAFENYGQDIKLAWMIVYGVSGLLTPASLSTALTVTEGGCINVRNNAIDLNWVQLLLSPFAWSVVFSTIIPVSYISPGFLIYHAKKANDEPVYNLTRQWHIFLGSPMIVICLFVFLSLRIQNSGRFYSAVFDYWWMFGINFLFFALASLLTFFKKKHGLAPVFVILQMMFALFGYGISELLYPLYPFVKIADAYVNPEMGWILVIVFILGLLLLLPPLTLLSRLFVFDKEYVEGKKP